MSGVVEIGLGTVGAAAALLAAGFSWRGNRTSTKALRLAEQDSASREVRWELHWIRGVVYALTQVGDGTALDVTVDMADPGSRLEFTPRDAMHPGEGMEIVVFRTSGSRSFTVRVMFTTAGRPGERQQRHLVLPRAEPSQPGR